MVTFIQRRRLFSPTKASTNELYNSTYKHLKVLMKLLVNLITGNFINFAVCEFYKDDTYEKILYMVLQCVLHQDQKELRLYTKVTKVLYRFIQEIFRKNLDLLMAKLNPEIIKTIIETILIPGI